LEGIEEARNRVYFGRRSKKPKGKKERDLPKKLRGVRRERRGDLNPAPFVWAFLKEKRKN